MDIEPQAQPVVEKKKRNSTWMPQAVAQAQAFLQQGKGEPVVIRGKPNAPHIRSSLWEYMKRHHITLKLHIKVSPYGDIYLWLTKE